MSDFIEVEQLPSSSELKAEDKVLINQNDDDTIVSLGELKEYCRPELATTTESGLVSTGEQSFSGKKTFTEVTTTKATVSNATIQKGKITEATVENLRITGSLIQDGEAVETEVETLKVQDQVIVTRSGATVGMGDGEYTGIKAEKYDGVNDGVLAFGPDGVARVGDEGSTQPLATREEAPTNNSIQIWDEQTQSFKSFPFGQKGQYLRQGENGLEYGSAVAVDEVQGYVDNKVQAEATLRQNAVETLQGEIDTVESNLTQEITDRTYQNQQINEIIESITSSSNLGLLKKIDNFYLTDYGEKTTTLTDGAVYLFLNTHIENFEVVLVTFWERNNLLKKKALLAETPTEINLTNNTSREVKFKATGGARAFLYRIWGHQSV